MKAHPSKQRRYVGLDLSGAKNSKTTLAVLEYYPKEKKVFLLDVRENLGAVGESTSDEVLVEILNEQVNEHPGVKLGVNAPLTLPPAFRCARDLKGEELKHSEASLKWMSHFVERAKFHRPKPKTSKRTARLKEFYTPYTQRPVELWLKYEVLAKLPEKLRFEMDETLGGNKAPLTARMQYLQGYLEKFEMTEVLPKLTVTLLVPQMKLNQRTMRQYRQLEDGAQARKTILEKMAEHLDIFIYDRDMKKLTQNLNAFDAFLCAYTVLLADRNECVPTPKNFPVHSGWIQYPKSPLLDERGHFFDEEDEAEEKDEG
jgi:hypothetical protein